ncbi:MAG: PTS sugar transporter subunit IIA [Opitutales bacterium]
MAGQLTALLDPACINLQVQGPHHEAALTEVARLLAGNPNVTNFDGFYRDLLARDQLDTTYLGHGIALPHARTEHVSRIVLAIGRSDTGVPFDVSNETVRLMFVLGTPKSNPTDYLMLVSALCKLLKSPAHREALMQATTPEAFAGALAAAESSGPTA